MRVSKKLRKPLMAAIAIVGIVIVLLASSSVGMFTAIDSTKIQSITKSTSPRGIFLSAYSLNNPSFAVQIPYAASEITTERMKEEVVRFHTLRSKLYEADFDFSKFDSNMIKGVGLIIRAMNDAYELNQQALALLSPEELDFAKTYGRLGREELTSEEASKLDQITLKIDKAKQAQGAFYILSAIEQARPLLKSSATQTSTCIGSCQIIVNTEVENNVYDQNAILIIDMFGEDTYNNNAGAGVLGTSLIWDMRDADKFNCDLFCQGYGFLGIGILFSDGVGNDVYKCTGGFCQGRSDLGGIGLLIDSDGQDLYDCSITSCQGSANGGVGMIVDYAAADQYLGCSIFCRGFANLGTALFADLSSVDICQGYCPTSTIGLGATVTTTGNLGIYLNVDS